MTKHSAARLLLSASLLVFTVGTVGMAAGVEPFHTWYFSFAWWPYIFAVESMLALRGGASLLFETPRRFALLLPLSVLLWLVFEAFNFRLGNWHYINLPASAPLRWAGYCLNFATVLPGLFCTANLLDSLGLFRTATARPLADATRLYRPMFLAGAACLLLPTVWPQYFFALVWGGFVLLLEPLNHSLGGQSLLADWERGEPRRTWLLLAAGLVCGGLWEFWNFKAGAKWYYTVPLAGDARLFEMPVLGFLGFPPFALECFVMTESCMLLLDRLRVQTPARRLVIGLAAAALAVAFSAAVIDGIDRLVVVSFR